MHPTNVSPPPEPSPLPNILIPAYNPGLEAELNIASLSLLPLIFYPPHPPVSPLTEDLSWMGLFPSQPYCVALFKRQSFQC